MPADTEANADSHEESQQPDKQCPECGSLNHTMIETRKDKDTILRLAFACDECFAGWESVYERVGKRVTEPPQVEA